LKSLLIEERKQNDHDQLLVGCSKLKAKHESLLSRVDEKAGEIENEKVKEYGKIKAELARLPEKG
jgi:hypothetical protein